MDAATATPSIAGVAFPRVVITFCVQCKWNLRAAYYAQELLQTFAGVIGEVALVPVTGGVFTVELYHKTLSSADSQVEGSGEAGAAIQCMQIWDRKTDGGFPETKELKNRVRNVIDPGRDMGHVDRALKKAQTQVEKRSEGDARDGSVPTKSDAAGTAHDGYAAAGAVPEDCVECREAVAEDEPHS